MNSSSYTQLKKSLSIAKGSKIQYTNNKVSVEFLNIGITPCIINKNQITYTIPKCICLLTKNR